MIDQSLKSLETGVAHSFGEWLNLLIPKVVIGAYTIWERERL